MRIVFLLINILIVGACALPKKEPSISIVAGIAPIARLAEYIGGESVAYIIPQGSDPHSFSLKTSDALKLEKAKYVISIHPSIDGAILKGDPKEIVLFDNEDYDHDHGHSHGHDHGSENTHYWLSLIHSKDIAYRLVQIWTAINPEKEAFYLSNTQTFISNIDVLSERLKAATQGKKIAVLQQHSAWDYLLEELDIKVLGSVEAFEGDQISPIRLAEVISLVKEQENPILVDDIFNAPSPVLDTIKKETGAKSYIFNPMASPDGDDDILTILASYGELLVNSSN
ncbi:MAG: metal ABC transporter substrate-binding protein [Brevinema sp.]